MKFDVVTDYQTYKEIMDELLKPISGQGLDADLMVRLYQSKLVYLENLRGKCFIEINRERSTPFTFDDYQLILNALEQTRSYLKQTMVLAITDNLSKRKAV